MLCNYKKHLKRVTLCEPLVNDVSLAAEKEKYLENVKDVKFECKCGKGYTTRQGMNIHKKACKYDEMEKLKQKIITLESQSTQAPTHVSNTQNNIHIIVNNNNPVKIKEFGCENMEALPKSLIETLFLDLKFRELLENLHCHPNFPENHNIRIKSLKREVVEVYMNNTWNAMSFVNGLTELLLQGQRIFKRYYRSDKERILEEDMDEKDLRELIQKLDDIEDLNEREMKPIRKELQLMLESYRNQLQKVGG